MYLHLAVTRPPSAYKQFHNWSACRRSRTRVWWTTPQKNKSPSSWLRTHQRRPLGCLNKSKQASILRAPVTPRSLPRTVASLIQSSLHHPMRDSDRTLSTPSLLNSIMIILPITSWTTSAKSKKELQLLSALTQNTSHRWCKEQVFCSLPVTRKS